MSTRTVFIAVWASVMIMILVFISVAFATCNKQVNDTKKTVSYTVDPAQIVGDTLEQRLESLRLVLAQKTEGFSRVDLRFVAEENGVAYDLMVYADDKVLIVDNAVWVSSEKLDELLRQLFVNTVIIDNTKRLRYIAIFIVDTETNIVGMGMARAGMEGLRVLPQEKWKKALDPAVVYGIAPRRLLPVANNGYD